MTVRAERGGGAVGVKKRPLPQWWEWNALAQGSAVVRRRGETIGVPDSEP